MRKSIKIILKFEVRVLCLLWKLCMKVPCSQRLLKVLSFQLIEKMSKKFHCGSNVMFKPYIEIHMDLEK